LAVEDKAAGPRTRAAADRNARFQGRRFYLTGAASGIGLATARLLVQGGAALAMADVNAAGLERAVAEIGGRPFRVDLHDGSAIDDSVAAAAEALGGLDGVINCAGVRHGARLEQLDPAEWDRIIAVNLTAPFRVCRAALPWLKAQAGASIVNVASGVALLPTAPGASAYAASKGGLVSFSKALATELAPDIRVNVVCPGVAATPMTEHVLGSADASAFLSLYALKRAADPPEIAEAIAFLSSSEASYITGVTLAADGGRTFH
jgi:NAD(P)-dependent dehydrogenase (short-subunit alcohol dehydrogenase family)